MKKYERTWGRAILAGIAALFLGGCKQEVAYAPQAVTGKVTVSLALKSGGGQEASRLLENEAARTVSPAAGDFTRYTLGFTPTSGGVGHEDVELNGVSAEVSLAVGTYTITATGYTGSSEAAVGEKTGVNVQAGETPPVGILLGPKAGGGNGTLRYTVTVPAGAGGSLSLTTSAGGAVDRGSMDLSQGTSTGTVSLAPGEYRLALSLNQGSGEAGPTTETVYIYSGLTSSFERGYTDADFTPLPPDGTGALGLTIRFGAETIPVIGGTNLTMMKGSGTHTLTLPNNGMLFGNVKWYLDGSADPTGTGNSFILDPDELGVKNHFVTVTAEKNGKTYSEIVEFTVAVAGGPGTGPEEPDEPEPIVPESVVDLAATLAELPVGTAANPNVVVLSGFDVCSDTWGTTVKNALKGLEKYITLDLSACTAKNNKIAGNGAGFTSGNFNSIKSNYIVGIVFPDTLTEIGDAACCEWTGLRYVTIPSGVTTIRASAFYQDSNLTSIAIPDTVSVIEAGAFWGTGLEDVTIPASVQQIKGIRSFHSAPLRRVTFVGNNTTITSSSFDGNFNEVYTAANPKAGSYVRDGTGKDDLWRKE